MKRWQNIFGEGRKTRGDAMVVVLCIFAVLLALAVSLLLAASTMTGDVYKRQHQLSGNREQLHWKEKLLD